MIITCSYVYFVPTAPSTSIVNATIIYPQNNPTVGQVYNLTCLYNVSEGFTHTPTVLWRHPNGTNFNTSSIVFDMLRASDNGMYTCVVMLTSPALNQTEMAIDTYNLTIQRKHTPVKHCISLFYFLISIPVPSPDISLSIPNTTLSAGSTVNIICSVTFTNELDINVTLSITWFKGITAVNMSNTTLISPLSNLFTSVLTISPLSATENNITCSAKILAADGTSLFLIASPTQSVSNNLMVESKSILSQLLYYTLNHNIKYIDPPIDVTITPRSTDIQNFGNQFNITCGISGLDDLNPNFTYQWTKDGGDSINLNSSITFPSLKLSNAGMYTCKVNISSNFFVGGHAIGMKNYNLLIQGRQMCLLPQSKLVLLSLQSLNHPQL